MSKFTDQQKKRLLSNKFVEKITDSQVHFTAKFKILAVEENLKGIVPSKIFTDAGIDISLFLEEFPKKSVTRWKKTYLEEGAVAFKSEKRGRKATGRPRRKFDPSNPQSVLDRLAYLEAENELLKKLHALAGRLPNKKGSL